MNRSPNAIIIFLITLLNHYPSINWFLARPCRMPRLSTTATLLHSKNGCINSCSNTALFGPSRWTSSAWGKSALSVRLIRRTVGGFCIIESKWLYKIGIVRMDNGARIGLLVVIDGEKRLYVVCQVFVSSHDHSNSMATWISLELVQ